MVKIISRFLLVYGTAVGGRRNRAGKRRDFLGKS